MKRTTEIKEKAQEKRGLKISNASKLPNQNQTLFNYHEEPITNQTQ